MLRKESLDGRAGPTTTNGAIVSDAPARRPQKEDPTALSRSRGRHFDAVASGNAERLAEGGENRPADRVFRLSPLGMPLDSQEKSGGGIHADRFDGAVRRLGFDPQRARQPRDALAV